MIPLLDLPKDPREAGRAHGRSLAREIRENLALYQERLAKAHGLSPKEGLRRAKAHLERLSSWAPEYLPGLLGLAEGADLTPEEAALLDARYELFYAEFAKEECTALVLRPPRAEDLILAQNWDWIPEVRLAWVRTRFQGLPVLAFTEAGIFGEKGGLNAAGLSLGLTGLVSPEDRWDGEGLPLHARIWRALRARTLSEAQEILSATPSPCSAGFLVCDEHNAVCVELSPSCAAVVPIADEFFVHTNHFLFLPWQAGAREDLRNSWARQARAEELLAARPRFQTVEVFEVLRDHQGFPGGICRHPEETRPPWDRWVTNLSLVLLPSLGRILFAHGPPCAASISHLSLTRTPQEAAQAPPA